MPVYNENLERIVLIKEPMDFAPVVIMGMIGFATGVLLSIITSAVF